jgi:uncharacterized membrane protein YtjA (UPF0391 family)
MRSARRRNRTDTTNGVRQGETIMLQYTIIFLIIALVAGAFGFFGVAGIAASIAKVLFFIFLVLFIAGLVLGRRSRIEP